MHVERIMYLIGKITGICECVGMWRHSMLIRLIMTSSAT